MKQGTKIARTVLAVAFILLVLGALFFQYVGAVKSSIASEANLYLMEVSAKGAEIIRTKVNGDMQTIGTMASMASRYKNLDSAELITSLNQEIQSGSFKRIGIITPEGIGHTTDNLFLELGDRDYFQLAMRGIPSVSDTLMDKADGGEVNVYAAPIYHGRSVIAVLFATHNTQTYKDMISVKSFGGHGYSYIVDKSGKVILHTNHPNSPKEFNNLFNFLKNDVEDVSESTNVLKQNFVLETSGLLEYSFAGEKQFMSYTPVGINDWYVISVVPSKVVMRRSDYLIRLTVAGVSIILFLMVLLIMYIVYTKNKSSAELERIAFIDSVTGIANWNKFKLDAEDLIRGSPQESYAILSLDIDKFKAVNDMYGYAQGNEILLQIAGMLVRNTRMGEVCARVGADNFNMLIHYTDTDDILARIEGIYAQLAALPTPEVQVSMGIYKIVDQAMDITTMHDRAGIARKTIKGNSNHPYAFFEEKNRMELLAEKEIESDMNHALQENQFVMYLQPKYRIDTGRICGAEALVRWVHPVRGMIYPGDFIPVFEKNGFITKLDMYMLDSVCRSMQRWQAKGWPVLGISVNLSRINLLNPNMPDNLRTIVNHYGVPPQNIEIEITESALSSSEASLEKMCDTLKEIGFVLSMDDFGSGYSSFNMLNKIYVDVLKIDRMFFNQTADTERGQRIIDSILSMAKALNITTVSEGVETQMQLDFLKSAGCDIAQGYYFAKPMPVEEFEVLLEAHYKDSTQEG